MMHGLTKLKFINAKQAGEIYKNIKRKLHKTIAAIWFNKVNPEAATAVIELLMMGGKMPKTC
jgi:hypothetical protein